MVVMKMAIYYGQYGTKYVTVKQLGAGGEGTVYTVEGYKEIVAKIYKTTKFKDSNERAVMERKLKAMIAMKLPYVVDGVARVAWPQDILYENGMMVGFTMPKIHTKYKIYDIYRGGQQRDKIYPDYNWKYSVQYAFHLAWLVNYLHSYNIIIGDFNQNNIAVNVEAGTIVIIDCDSFDIVDPVTKEHFPCTVGLPEMLAPELQTVGDLRKANFTKSTDYFSLAIHIFRLLMDNADPFGAVIKTAESVSSIPENRAICNGECVYVRDVPGRARPEWAVDPKMLPQEILYLFKKTFDYTALTAMKKIPERTSAYEWCVALLPYAKPEPNPKLKRCPKNRRHVYPAHNSECPWCAKHKQTPRPKPIPGPSPTPKTANRWWVIIPILGIIAVLAIAYKYYVYDGGSWGGTDTSYDNTQEDETYNDSYYDSEDETYDDSYYDSEDETDEEDSDDYILTDSDTSYITEEDLESLTDREVQLARNEIFARHGRKFDTEWIQDYFDGKDWYVAEYEPEYFDEYILDSEFNNYEKENVKFMADYENTNSN